MDGIEWAYLTSHASEFSSENSPAPHSVQVDDAEPDRVPAAQGVQDVAALSAACLPTAHPLHVADPESSAKRPAAQLEHSAWPAAAFLPNHDILCEYAWQQH